MQSKLAAEKEMRISTELQLEGIRQNVSQAQGDVNRSLGELQVRCAPNSKYVATWNPPPPPSPPQPPRTPPPLPPSLTQKTAPENAPPKHPKYPAHPQPP